MQSTKTMKAKHMFGFLVAVLALVVLLPNVSAFANSGDVWVNGDLYESGDVAGVYAGDTIGVRVSFTGIEEAEDARLVARLEGEPSVSAYTERFDVLAGSTYSRLLNIELPYDIDRNENFILEVKLEGRKTSDSKSDTAFTIPIELEIQRSNYEVEILSLDMDDNVKAGDNLVLDFVVLNRGRHEAENSFVKASIPALGISKKVFLGDLYPEDNYMNDEDAEDAIAGRIFLVVPRDAPAGVYDVEVEAFNDDSTTLATRRVVVLGAGADSDVISSTSSKTFAVGEEQEYTVTIVNADNIIKVYEFVLEAANGLTVNLDESMVAVPAGTSKTVKLKAMASEEGTYTFAVNVHSDGELVKKQNFVANVEGRTAGGNAAVILTIILAIIFIVLLIVLIVLLTRKPEKTEDFGESYY